MHALPFAFLPLREPDPFLYYETVCPSVVHLAAEYENNLREALIEDALARDHSAAGCTVGGNDFAGAPGS
jgi:hypothetical protein